MVERTDVVLSGAVWKVGHEGNSVFHDQAKGRRGHCDTVCEGFGGNSVVGACEPITCAVPDYDYATCNGTEI